jgi:predicted AAA+ superfamily ATPase
MTEIIKTLLWEWKERKIPLIFKRDVDLSRYIKAKVNKITAITGFRRTGKTYSMFHLISELLKENSKEKAAYFNFEDERIPRKTEFLTQLMPAISRTYKEKIKYLFLDEIQNIPDWSKWLRRIYDTEADIRIFVSGSSSKMSGEEIPTELRGRFLEVKMFPLSFKEYLRFNNFEFDLKSLDYSGENKAVVLKALDDFQEYGALPEIVLSEEEKKVEIAKSYYQTVVRRDIIEKHKIKNEEALKALLMLLLNSTKYSISKLYNTLKSLGHKVGKNTLQNYLRFIEESYFMFSVPIFSYSVKDQMQYARKNYFIDTVFISKLSHKFSKNYGRLYENTVALELKRRGQEFYYWENSKQHEVDFAVKKDNKIKQLIQVCYDTADLTARKREIRSLIAASKDLKCDNLLIITNDYEAQKEEEWFGTKRKIKFIPLWKWLLA